MLAAFAAPDQKKPPARELDGLEDDVATLSYERALRAHARYRSSQPSDHALTQPYQADRFHAEEPVEPGDIPAATSRTQQVSAFSQAEPELQMDPQTESARTDSAYERNLKSASITIRLSKTECAQLRQRAAEAGLTISAYLRSCTIEAESLRAQVKDTLAQLRSESLREYPLEAAPARLSWLARLWALWPFPHNRGEGVGSKTAVLRARLS